MISGKRTVVCGLLLVTVLTAAGCGSSTDQPASTSAQGERPGNPSDGQRTGQFSRADVSGQVESIAGNEVKLKLIEMPAPRANENAGQGSGGMRQGQNSGQGASSGQSQGRAIKFTGETQTLLIPIGVPLTTMTRGQNGPEVKEADLKDIKKGSMLNIWYADKTSKTIDRISISAPRQNGSGPQP